MYSLYAKAVSLSFSSTEFSSSVGDSWISEFDFNCSFSFKEQLNLGLASFLIDICAWEEEVQVTHPVLLNF